MNHRKFNWQIWSAFLLSVIAFFSYPFIFVRFPVTRDFPWANLLLFGIAGVLLIFGLSQAFAADRPHRTRSRIVGSAVSVLAVAILGFFIFSIFVIARWLPASHGAPQVGQKAPDFTLADINNKPVALSELISTPIDGKTPSGVLLIFYRGYW